MSSPFTPVAIGACDLLCRLDASSPSSSVPARIARSSGFESARGRTRMQVSVPSDFGHFTCHLHLTVDDNQATAVLGADWFKLFAEFVMSQPPLSSNGPGSSQSSNMQTSEDGPATNLQYVPLPVHVPKANVPKGRGRTYWPGPLCRPVTSSLFGILSTFILKTTPSEEIRSIYICAIMAFILICVRRSMLSSLWLFISCTVCASGARAPGVMTYTRWRCLRSRSHLRRL